MNLTRSVLAGGLRQHHLGREFVAIGILRKVSITTEGVLLHVDAGVFTVEEDERLDYWFEPPVPAKQSAHRRGA